MLICVSLMLISLLNSKIDMWTNMETAMWFVCWWTNRWNKTCLRSIFLFCVGFTLLSRASPLGTMCSLLVLWFGTQGTFILQGKCASVNIKMTERQTFIKWGKVDYVREVGKENWTTVFSYTEQFKKRVNMEVSENWFP